jgi:chromosome segregation ATPase
MIRERVTTAAPVAPSKTSSADQRENFLRAYGKFLEVKEKAAREGWEVREEQARELDRRFQAIRAELKARDDQLAETNQELERARGELKAVGTEFQTFQGEITRIFQEKDGEERETLGRLNELEDTNSNLSRELEEAQKRIDDDQQRLKIFQEELDTLEAEQHRLGGELDEAKSTIAERDEALRAAEKQLGEIRARLDATDAMLVERGEEIEELKERLDRVLIDAQNERRRLEDSHAETIASAGTSRALEIAEKDRAYAELQGELDRTEMELRAELDGLERQGRAGSAAGEISAERDALTRPSPISKPPSTTLEVTGAERQRELTAALEELSSRASARPR